MKRKLLLLAVIILGAPLLLLLRSPRLPPLVTSSFLGFTNLVTAPAALFAVTNYPEGATHPAVIAIAVQQGGSWKELPLPARGALPMWEFTVGAQPEVLYRFAVPVTHQPVRIVMQIQTPPRGIRASIERLVERTGLRGGHPLFRPPTAYFTNETVVSGAVVPIRR